MQPCMRDIGFDGHLYVLPFEHRSWFQTQMFGGPGPLSANQIQEVVSSMELIYDAFKAAIATGVRPDRGCIAVDEQFGDGILRDAVRRGYLTVSAAGHFEAFSPTFCKVQLRYNPCGDKALNLRHAARLRRLSENLHKRRMRLMCELLAPPLECLSNYDSELRAQMTIQAIENLHRCHVEPDVWLVQGLDSREDCRRVVAVARQDWRKKVICIISDEGEDDSQITRWVTTASAVPGFRGFAMGRITYAGPLSSWRRGKLSRQDAVATITRRYRRLVDTFERKLCAAA
jgi:myo-inositol catabolism protein IolC